MDQTARESHRLDSTPPAGGGASRPARVALPMVGMIAPCFPLRELGSRVAGSWPCVLLLAGSLMHLVHGHGGHGPHTGHRSGPGQE